MSDNRPNAFPYHSSLDIYVQPGAKRSALVGPHANAWKIAIAAPPEKGKANSALIDFLSELLEIPKQSIAIISGLTNRHKRVRIEVTSRDVQQRLEASFRES